MTKYKGNRRVSVSDLAMFSDNPEAFVKRKGRAINAKAARYGTHVHDNLGRVPSPARALKRGLFIIVGVATFMAIAWWAK